MINTDAKPYMTIGKSQISYRVPSCSDLVSNFSDLASAIRNHWGVFAEIMEGGTDKKLTRFIEAVGKSNEYFLAAQDSLLVISSSDSPENKLIQLQALLDSSIVPVFRGVSLDRDSILAIADEAKKGDAKALAWLDAVIEIQALGALSEVSGSEELAKTDYYLSKWSKQVNESLSSLPSDCKEVDAVIRKSAAPILVASALAVGFDESFDSLVSINESSKKLCSLNYMEARETVKPIINLLKSNDIYDAGKAIVFNMYLTRVYEDEMNRAEKLYSQAKRNLELKRFQVAIKELKAIPSYKDAGKLLMHAGDLFHKAEGEYLEAAKAIESSDFQKAHSAYIHLKEYKNAAEMSEVTEKALSLVEGLMLSKRKVEKETERLTKEIEELIYAQEENNVNISTIQNDLSRIDKSIRDTGHAIDISCSNATADLDVQISESRSKLSEIATLIKSNKARQKQIETDSYNLAERIEYTRSLLFAAKCKLKISKQSQADCKKSYGKSQNVSKSLGDLEKEIGTLEAELVSLCSLKTPESESETKCLEAAIRELESTSCDLKRCIHRLQCEKQEIQRKTKEMNSGNLSALEQSRESLRNHLEAMIVKKRSLTSSIGQKCRLKEKSFERSEEIEKKKNDTKAICSYCSIFSNISEQKYRRYLSVSNAICKGNCIRLGRYNATQLEWDVLKTENGQALLLGPVLEEKALDETGLAKSWEECSLCHWLNEGFFYEAFDEFEREAVAYGGRLFNHKVSLVDKHAVDCLKRHLESKNDDSWWTCEFVHGEETAQFKEFKIQYVKDHTDCDYKSIIDKVKKIGGLSAKELEVRYVISGMDIDDCLLGMLIEDSSFAALIQSLELSEALFSRTDKTNGLVRRFKRSLPALVLQALESYGGDPYVEKKKALTVRQGKLEGDGKPLTTELGVRPVVWIPYYI